MGFRVRHSGGNLFLFQTGLGLLILPVKGHGCFPLLFDRTRQGMVVKFITPSYFFFSPLPSLPFSFPWAPTPPTTDR